MLNSIKKYIGKVARGWDGPGSSLENPNTWFINWASGLLSSSGRRVGAANSLTLSPVWRGVSLLARDVAKLPLNVYRKNADGGRERADTHPASILLKRQPNQQHTAFVFKQALVSSAILHGNGYAWIERDSQMRPVGLWLLDAGRTSAEVSQVDRGLFYRTFIDDEEVIILGPDMLHIRGLCVDGVDGLSLVNKAREAFGVALAAQAYQGTFYKNSARPSVVLEHPGRLREDGADRLKKHWEKLHSGSENAGKVAVLEEGLTVKPFSVTAKDAQMIEQMNFGVREVANFLGVPPHKLGSPDRTSYSSLEQENLSYLQESLDPWLCVIEEEFTNKLIGTQAARSGSVYIEFTREALVRADINTRFDAYSKALTDGWLSRNEVRLRENLNPIEGGDEYLVQLNMGPATEDDTTDDDDQNDLPAREDEDEEDDPTRSLAQDAIRKALGRLANQARRKAKHSREALNSWNIDQLQHQRAKLVEIIGKPLQAIGCDCPEPAADRLISETREAFQVIIDKATDDTLIESFEDVTTLLQDRLPQQLLEDY